MCAKVGASNIVRMVEEMPLEWHEDDREQRLKTLWHSVNCILETQAEDRIRDRLRVSRPNLDKRTVNQLLYRARKAGRLIELDEAEDIGALADSLNQ